MSTKTERYQELVAKRKKCALCPELINPAFHLNGLYDSNHIGPWTRWQGNLDSSILLVGQDWGDIGTFEKFKGLDPTRREESLSNFYLTELFASIGFPISLPQGRDTEGRFFFTNALLCLKKGEMKTPVSQNWVNTCAAIFLKSLIDIVQPRILIGMGLPATNSILSLMGRGPTTMTKAIALEKGLRYSNTTAFFPLYHCGPLGRANRSATRQLEDWKRIRRALDQ